MHKFVVEGGHRLAGEVHISGSKNACLPVMAAALLASGESVIHNVPHLDDIRTRLTLFGHLGAGVREEGDTILIDGSGILTVEATYDIVRKMRASVLVLGPLVARFGRARVSLPGGCAIGARPIDLHLKGLEAMGAKIVLEHGYVDATAPAGGLVGAKIMLDMPSVTATENLMMAACLARGITHIENAAREPEIEELAEALITMGAKIQGAGTSVIQIEGRDYLSPMTHITGPDRIETGTFIAIAAITKGDVLLRDVRLDHLEAFNTQFTKAGCEISVVNERKNGTMLSDLRVVGPQKLRCVDLRTAPFPGFATDMQAQFLACMTLADGTSHVEETIFENRFMHTLELMRMGADISMHGNLAVVRGVEKLSGAPVMATDLRASASLVIAALAAEGTSEILRIYHLDRGYAELEKKLALLGAKVAREVQ
jgi:UDP-N-acetylglucosamine 1-carboxyvinyltransferase